MCVHMQKIRNMSIANLNHNIYCTSKSYVLHSTTHSVYIMHDNLLQSMCKTGFLFSTYVR